MNIGGKVTGLDDMLKRVRALEKKVAKKLNKDACFAGGDVVLKAMKPGVPIGTGSLKKSLGKKAGIGRKAGTAYCVVGPRTKFKKDRKTGLRVLTKTGARYAEGSWPTKYFHLVEFGTKRRTSKTTGANRGAMPSHQMLRPAVRDSKSAVRAAMADKLREGLGG